MRKLYKIKHIFIGHRIYKLTNSTCGVMLNSPGGWSLSGLVDYYTFADGTPFGVKKEE